MQGGYDITSGNFVSNNTAVCTKTPIPCKEGDNIEITTEKAWYYLGFLFFDENGNFISALKSENTNPETTKEYSAIAPTNASYFHVNLSAVANVTIADAKHICVTLNGQYALRVKTSNKNFLENKATSQTINGITFTVNDDKSVTVNGTATANAILNINSFNTDKSCILSGCPSGGGSKYTLQAFGMSSGNENGNGLELVTNIELTIRIVVYGGQTVSNITFYPMIRLATVTDDTYEPHQESEALIPVSSPFYKGDYIDVYVDGSGREYRVNKRFENPTLNSGGGLWYWFNGDGALKPYTKCYCNKLNHADNKIGTDEKGNVVLKLLEGQSIDDLATSAFVCKLATPTSTPLTAEQVAEFLKLRTYKGVTYVTADGEVVMRYYVDNASGETVNMLQGMVSNDGSSDLTELFKTITVSESATLPANQITSISIPINVPSGYSIFGIKSIHNNTLELLYGFSCGDDSVSVSVKNTSELETQGSVSVSVSCIKTSAI